MAKLKAYTLGIHGFVAPVVGDLLGEPAHVRQASVLVVAETKRAAVGVAARARGVPTPSLSDPEFRVATGNDVDALAAAGMLDEPTVLVTKLTASSSPVVQVGPDGPTVVGEIKPDGSYRSVFVPVASALRAADLPERSIVVDDSRQIVWYAIAEPAEGSARWDCGQEDQENDATVQYAIDNRGATVLRVGDGTGRIEG